MQQASERRLTRLQRVAPQVLAIQLEEVEGVEEDCLPLRRSCSNTASRFGMRGFGLSALTATEITPASRQRKQIRPPG